MTQQINRAEKNSDNSPSQSSSEATTEVADISASGLTSKIVGMGGASEPPPVQRAVNHLQKLPSQRMRQASFKSLGGQHSNSYLARVAADYRSAQRNQENIKAAPQTEPISNISVVSRATLEDLPPEVEDDASPIELPPGGKIDENQPIPPDQIEAQIAAEMGKVPEVKAEGGEESGGGAAVPNVPDVSAAAQASVAPSSALVAPPKPALPRKLPLVLPKFTKAAGKSALPKIQKPFKKGMSRIGPPAPKAPLPPKLAKTARTSVAQLATSVSTKIKAASKAKKPLARLLGGVRQGAGRVARLLKPAVNLSKIGLLGQGKPVQRAAACPEAPVKPVLSPEQDPGFKSVKGKATQTAKDQKNHPSAKSKANEAQGAAVGPSNEIAAQAAAGQVEDMGQQKPKGFDKQAFVSALHQAIDAATPKNQEQADEFKQSGKAGEIKGRVSGIVSDKKKDSEKDIKETSEATPDPSKAKDGPKPVTPMQPEQPGAAPGPIGAEAAMPKPKSAAETSLEAGKCEVNSVMEDAKVTEEQLQKSNEPDFQQAVKDKKEAEVNANTAPQQFRDKEQATLQQAQGEAGAKSTQAVSGMNATRSTVLGQVGGAKDTTKSSDEKARNDVTNEIEKRYNQTKQDVTKILGDLDGKVSTAFENGEKSARDQFENVVKSKMDAYKKKRYDGPGGWVQWGIDKILDLPSEVNAFYQEGRDRYLNLMEGVIDNVATIVVSELNRAKDRIEQGRKDINTYVSGLSPELQKIGQDAAEKVQSKFDQLDQEVDSKQDSLVQDLAQKYVEARSAVDERINQMKEENKGFVSKAKDAVTGVVKTILQLKDMLLGVLAKAAGVIDKIIKDPIGFLGNLVNAVGSGLKMFASNIGTHLKNGLMGWLFGALGQAGIEMPKNLDLEGIFSLVMQVLGLTYANIKDRAIKLVGEKTVGFIEKSVDVFKNMLALGPAGIWKFIKDKVGDLKETVIGGIEGFIKEKVITAGITWIMGLLTPASAFIKACKAIYDIIMFFVERGSQIMELVNAVLDSVSAIANGSIGQAASFVENALAKALPVAISFLASLLGIGGIGEKIKKIIQSVQNPINKAIDAVIKGVIKPFKKLGLDKLLNKAKAKAKQGVNYVKGKAKQGADWAKGKAKQGANWVKGKVKGATDWVKGKAKGATDWVKGKFKQGVDKVKGKFNSIFGKGKDKDKDKNPDPNKVNKPLEVAFSMSGTSHKLIVTPGVASKVEMASKRDLLSNKIGRAVSKLIQIGKTQNQINELKALGSKVKAVYKLIKQQEALKQPVSESAPEIAAMVGATVAYGSKYSASDIDVLNDDIEDLRSHAAYNWLKANGLDGAFEARIVPHVKTFTKARIKNIFDQIVRFKGNAAFEAKVKKAVGSNKFWSPNSGFFFEITDLKSINDIKFFDVSVGTKTIDVLTGAGVLMDQKYQVELDPTTLRLSNRLQGQLTAMQGAIGTTINGITVTNFEFHIAQSLDVNVLNYLKTQGLESHFKMGHW